MNEILDQDIFVSYSNGDESASVGRALNDMMLEGAWRAAGNSDYEFALEYPIAVLSLENSNDAAITLAAISLMFFGDMESNSNIRHLLQEFVASKPRLAQLEFELLDNIVTKSERLVLLQQARSLKEDARHRMPGIEKIESDIVARATNLLRFIYAGDTTKSTEAIWLSEKSGALPSEISDRMVIGNPEVAMYCLTSVSVRPDAARTAKAALSRILRPRALRWIGVFSAGSALLRLQVMTRWHAATWRSNKDDTSAE